ncbi:hypothetical protein IRJ41_012331 [Triplophysa rosa]|uniref:Uncharacterized protein n=1 Tax=Triplophysa rosa TaxID=992332 RepID=A0A9W7X5G8_TRIRA|nr:hypothetical protein IRJ41_012331 [Triplophysa rosa]
MALFTARPKRAGTKGATTSAVQYIPHAEQGLVLEPWAKSTAPLVLSDGGKTGGGKEPPKGDKSLQTETLLLQSQHGTYVAVDAGGPIGLQTPPKDFGGSRQQEKR